jgi:hypothetical protein
MEQFDMEDVPFNPRNRLRKESAMDIVIIMTILDKIMEMIRECRENQCC